MSADGSYADVAGDQIDALEAGPDMELFNAVLDACELVFRATGLAQSKSSAVRSANGIVLRLPVTGHPPYKVFWSQTPDGPRIEAVLPHP